MARQGFAAVLDSVRSTISKLRPATLGDAGEARFTPTDGLMQIEDEPDICDRRFEVRADDIGTTQDQMMGDARQVRQRFSVLIRYDARHHLVSLERRLNEDSEQIIDTLEAARSYATGVQRVTHVDGEIRRDDPQFPLVRLGFEVLFTRPTF